MPRRTFRPTSSLLIALTLLAGCAATGRDTSPPILAERIAAHVEVLAADAFEGRAPGTAGEEKTLDYIEAAYRAAGLEPLTGAGFRIPVPLLTSSAVAGRIDVGSLSIENGAAAMVRAPAPEERRIVEGDIVFAGYGIAAPAQGRDDFAGEDWQGKIALILAGMPGGEGQTDVPEAVRAQAGSAARTANALRAGAAGVILLHDMPETDEAWRTARAQLARDWMRLDHDTPARSLPAAALARSAAAMLAGHFNTDLAALTQAADAPGFRAQTLGAGRMAASNRITRFVSSNVAGVLRGTRRPDDYVIYLAHWDHLGLCGAGDDKLCNGAVDNASGVGGLIEMAHAFAKGRRPHRSVVFLATTAEESGLLGARHFAAAGPIPAQRMVAAFGIDTIAAAGDSGKLVVLGAGLTTLDAGVKAAAKAQGRSVVSMPGVQSFYARSDHYAFAEVGVPAIIATGIFAEGGADDYMANRYHQPSDEISAGIDYSGAAADMSLLLAVGRDLANSGSWPQWTKSSPHRRQP